MPGGVAKGMEGREAATRMQGKGEQRRVCRGEARGMEGREAATRMQGEGERRRGCRGRGEGVAGEGGEAKGLQGEG